MIIYSLILFTFISYKDRFLVFSVVEMFMND